MAEEIVWSGARAPASLIWYWVIGVLTFWVLGLGFIIIALGVVRMYSKKYELTSERIRVTKGLLSHSVREAELDKITDVAVQQDIFGRLLNYGHLFFNTAGSQDYEISFFNISDPKGLKEKFREAMKKSKA